RPQRCGSAPSQLWSVPFVIRRREFACCRASKCGHFPHSVAVEGRHGGRRGLGRPTAQCSPVLAPVSGLAICMRLAAGPWSATHACHPRRPFPVPCLCALLEYVPSLLREWWTVQRRELCQTTLLCTSRALGRHR